MAESALLGFKCWVDVELKDEASDPIPHEELGFTFADGSRRKGI
jgi:hypothetical protein